MIDIEGLQMFPPFTGQQQKVIQVLYLNDLHGRAALGKIAEHHSLHSDTLEDDLVHHAGVDGGDDGTLAGDDLHKVVLLQPLQYTADRRARDAEPLAQLVLAQAFPGQDLQRTDLVLQNMIDFIGALLYCHGASPVDVVIVHPHFTVSGAEYQCCFRTNPTKYPAMCTALAGFGEKCTGFFKSNKK